MLKWSAGVLYISGGVTVFRTRLFLSAGTTPEATTHPQPDEPNASASRKSR
jgi:hypothetical protein